MVQIKDSGNRNNGIHGTRAVLITTSGSAIGPDHHLFCVTYVTCTSVSGKSDEKNVQIKDYG